MPVSAEPTPTSRPMPTSRVVETGCEASLYVEACLASRVRKPAKKIVAVTNARTIRASKLWISAAPSAAPGTAPSTMVNALCRCSRSRLRSHKAAAPGKPKANEDAAIAFGAATSPSPIRAGTTSTPPMPVAPIRTPASITAAKLAMVTVSPDLAVRAAGG